jgi:hypothetical protein
MDKRRGTAAGAPACVADSTSNTKRVPIELSRGSSATTPVTTMSCPSSAVGRRSARRCAARQSVDANAASASAAAASANRAEPRRRHASAANPTATSATAAEAGCGHRVGCCNCKATPPSHASASHTMRHPRSRLRAIGPV